MWMLWSLQLTHRFPSWIFFVIIPAIFKCDTVSDVADLHSTCISPKTRENVFPSFVLFFHTFRHIIPRYSDFNGFALFLWNNSKFFFSIIELLCHHACSLPQLHTHARTHALKHSCAHGEKEKEEDREHDYHIIIQLRHKHRWQPEIGCLSI